MNIAWGATLWWWLKTNIWMPTSKTLILATGVLQHPWGSVTQFLSMRGWTNDRNHFSWHASATWTLTMLAVRASLCCTNPVVKTKVRIQMLVFSDLKTNARKDHFWNGCTQGFFCAPMRATRKAILTDVRNRLLGNGCAQGMRQIPDARNPFNLSCDASLACLFSWPYYCNCVCCELLDLSFCIRLNTNNSNKCEVSSPKTSTQA